VIVGAGHIALPLARIAKLADYEVVVLDDRAEYASAERFPDVDSLLIGPYASTLATVPIDPYTCIVLVTRGHVHDQASLETVIESPAAYIGMIGSKRRVRTVLRHLGEKGVDSELLARIHAPIGLDIGARTPAEIAVAIMAEIIQSVRGGTGRPLGRGEAARA
jgi:xanthine dehydrogenase accessory factor